jgi:type II secretion system protein N
MAAITKRNLLAWAGYAAFFLFCFSIGAYLTFPYDRVRDTLIARVQAGNGPGSPETKLSIGDLGPSFLTGVALTSVTLERASQTPGDPPSKLSADEVELRVSPLKLLFGGVGVHFAATAGGGDIEGRYDAAKDGPMHFESELDALDIGKVGLGSMIGLPLFGEASGDVDITLSDKPAETQGNVDLKVERVKLGDAKGAKLRVPGMSGPLTLDTIDAGTLELKLAIKDGVATIERFESKGKDVELNSSGSIRLAQQLGQSRADITLAARFSDAYRHKSDRTKSMFELLNMQHVVGPDGELRVKLTGGLDALRALPAPAAPGAAKARAARAKRE